MCCPAETIIRLTKSGSGAPCHGGKLFSSCIITAPNSSTKKLHFDFKVELSVSFGTKVHGSAVHYVFISLKLNRGELRHFLQDTRSCVHTKACLPANQ